MSDDVENPGMDAIIKQVGQIHAVLRSIHEFNNAEVLGVVHAISSPTDHQQCFIAPYFRSVANVRTLLELTHPKHFQAIEMLARTIFELAVDVRLLDSVTEGPAKMLASSRYERLKSAKKIVDFAASSGKTVDNLAIYQQHVAENEASVETECKRLWPTHKKPPDHWSGLKLTDRVSVLKAPFDEMYATSYARMSWSVHAGAAGVFGLDATTFPAMCAIALRLVIDCYQLILNAMIDELNLEVADPKIKNKLRLAKLLPLTENSGQQQRLIAELLG